MPSQNQLIKVSVLPFFFGLPEMINIFFIMITNYTDKYPVCQLYCFD
jgi:hypothetical protein